MKIDLQTDKMFIGGILLEKSIDMRENRIYLEKDGNDDYIFINIDEK